MKKIMVIFMCCCLSLFSLSFALENRYFSIDLPDEYLSIYEQDSGGLYSSEEMSILYTCEKPGSDEYFKDAKEMKKDLEKELGEEVEVEKINGVNFLRTEVSDEESEIIMYLGSTSQNLVTIMFMGENVNENEVEDIMETVKLKGMSSGAFNFLFNILPYLIVGIVVVVVSVVKKNKVQPKKGDSSNNYETNQSDMFGSDTNEPYNEIKDEWKL